MLDINMSNKGGFYCKDILLLQQKVTMGVYKFMKDGEMSWNVYMVKRT